MIFNRVPSNGFYQLKKKNTNQELLQNLPRVIKNAIELYWLILTLYFLFRRKYGTRERLVTEDTYYTNNDLRHFEVGDEMQFKHKLYNDYPHN